MSAVVDKIAKRLRERGYKVCTSYMGYEVDGPGLPSRGSFHDVVAKEMGLDRLVDDVFARMCEMQREARGDKP